MLPTRPVGPRHSSWFAGMHAYCCCGGRVCSLSPPQVQARPLPGRVRLPSFLLVSSAPTSLLMHILVYGTKVQALPHSGIVFMSKKDRSC